MLSWEPVTTELAAEPHQLHLTVTGTLASGAVNAIGAGSVQLPPALMSVGAREELSVAITKGGRHLGEAALVVES